MRAFKISWKQRERTFELKKYWLYKAKGSPWGYHVVVPVFVDAREDAVPLAPGHGYVFDKPPDRAYIAQRLYSTHRGRLWWWKVSQRGQGGLNKSPYWPIWRGWVKEFCWSPEGKEFVRDRARILWVDWDVVQGGTGGKVWGANLAEDVTPYLQAPDWITPAPAIAGALPNLKLDYPDAKQGHLWVFRVGAPFERITVEDIWPIETARFYDHIIYKTIVLGKTGTRMAIYVKDGTWITSPDHVDQPVRLNSGYWILEHPVPNGDVD